MKAHSFSLLGFLFVSLSMLGLPAAASTPDGDTPAEETVCDTLKADGFTQGLYGLCLAFCEAQDLASEDYPITDEELAILQDTPPSGSILNAYNNIRQASDPDMPCIVVDSACPCWTEEELAEIDGMIPGANGFLDCDIRPDDGFALAAEVEILTSGQQRLSILAAASEQFRNCDYRNLQGDPDIRRFTGLSSGQAAVCVQQVADHCATLGY